MLGLKLNHASKRGTRGINEVCRSSISLKLAKTAGQKYICGIGDHDEANYQRHSACYRKHETEEKFVYIRLEMRLI